MKFHGLYERDNSQTRTAVVRLAADSEGNRPRFRFQIARDSEMKSPTVPR